jgi:hypothetical protein
MTFEVVVIACILLTNVAALRIWARSELSLLCGSSQSTELDHPDSMIQSIFENGNQLISNDDLHPFSSPQKVRSNVKVEVVLNEDDIDESFVKGSGNGGQKINKTSNRVVLVHKPTGLKVSCQDARDLSTNRKWARGMLKEKLDFYYNGTLSKTGIQQEKTKRRKKDSARYV